MFNEKQLAAFVVIFAAHDIFTSIALSRTLKRFRKSIDNNAEEREVYHEQIKYLCHMLEEHNVPVTEFDAIALTFRHEK